jgi:hypothetical protein
MSSLTSTATREGNAENPKGIMKNRHAYGQDQRNTLEVAFNNKEAIYDLQEEVQEKMTPWKRTPENNITSPCTVVTESRETLIKDSDLKKV